jgi:antitoxin YefM
MDTVPYGRARQSLARLMDKVCDERAPVTITRPDKPPVVLMDLGEYQRMEETLQLLRRPANALRLTRSIRAADLSQVRVYALIKPEARSRRRAGR